MPSSATPRRPACPLDGVIPAGLADAIDRRTVAERVAEILASLEARNGPWGRGAKAAKAWRSAFEICFTRALTAIPVLLADPIPGVRWAVLGPHRVVVLDEHGGLGFAGFDRLTHGQPITDNQKGDDAYRLPWGSVPGTSITSDPSSLFHWDRPMVPVPTHDPVAAAKYQWWLEKARDRADVARPELAFQGNLDTLLRPPTRPRRGRRGVSPVPDEALALANIRKGDNGKRDMPSTVWAAGMMLGKLTDSAGRAASCAAIRLLDPVLLREARRCGPSTIYWWLAAIEADCNPDLVLRRRQFAACYPELADGVAYASSNSRSREYDEIAGWDAPGDKEKLVAIRRAVDAAQPVTDMVTALRSWPKWVERALRGRLTARACGGQLYREGGVNPKAVRAVGNGLAALGPAWRPRGGDQVAMASMVLLADAMGMDVTAVIGASCRDPGTPGASPWKRVWRRVRPLLAPPRFGTDSLVSRAAADALDTIAAFEREVLRPLAPPQLAAQSAYIHGHHNRRYCPSPLREMTLPGLLTVSAEWHARREEIQRAKLRDAKIDRATQPDAWEPLFAPFTLLRDRVEVACITERVALETHGREMGHCVGGYWWECLVGTYHVVSFRVDGAWAATAAFDLDVSGKPVTTQARGRNNGNVPTAAQAALDLVVGGLEAEGSTWARATPGLEGILAITPSSNLEQARVARANARPADAYGRRQEGPGYDVGDPVVTDRVLTAWRFAMPSTMRAAWERAATPEARIAAVREWFTRWATRHLAENHRRAA